MKLPFRQLALTPSLTREGFGEDFYCFQGLFGSGSVGSQPLRESVRSMVGTGSGAGPVSSFSYMYTKVFLGQLSKSHFTSLTVIRIQPCEAASPSLLNSSLFKASLLFEV